MQAQLGQIRHNKIENNQNSTATSQMMGSKAESKCMHCAHSTTKRVGKPPKPSLQPDPWIHSSAHPYKGLVHASPNPPPLPPWEQAREPVSRFLLPHFAARVPVKACLNFLSGLLSTFFDQAVQELWSTTKSLK